MHVDFLRVDLDKPIQATTVLELTGVEDAPGVKEGGVLEQVTHELNIEALPAAIPDSISHDVSAMEINDTVMLSAVTAPEGVTLLDDLEDTVVATLSPPRAPDGGRGGYRGGDGCRRRGRRGRRRRRRRAATATKRASSSCASAAPPSTG